MGDQQPDIRISHHDGKNNGYLSPPERDGPTSPTRHRSTSLTPSERSRITLVEDDYDLVEHVPSNEPGISNVTIEDRQGGWFDRVLGFMGLQRRSKVMKGGPQKDPVNSEREQRWTSPWILPVMVYSTRRDSNRDYIHHQAQCTIDTGNAQGNIVSRDFVFDTLEHTESDVRELTELEKRTPGISITGHELHPEGAIYLTWYHRDSTRVFRNMRFLISKHPQFDLVIGARSISAHNLLSVPNLMSGGTDTDFVEGQDPNEDPKLRSARALRAQCDSKIADLEQDIEDALREHQPQEADRLKRVKDQWFTYWSQYHAQVQYWANKDTRLIEQFKAEKIVAEEKVKTLEASSSTPIPKQELAKNKRPRLVLPRGVPLKGR